jgi:hypothetical protein
MNWIYQVLSFFVAFGPVILGVALWHLLWNGGSDSGGGPPGGPDARPVPPPPSFSGDRRPRHDAPTPSTPRLPRPERA